MHSLRRAYRIHRSHLSPNIEKYISDIKGAPTQLGRAAIIRSFFGELEKSYGKTPRWVETKFRQAKEFKEKVEDCCVGGGFNIHKNTNKPPEHSLYSKKFKKPNFFGLGGTTEEKKQELRKSDLELDMLVNNYVQKYRYMMEKNRTDKERDRLAGQKGRPLSSVSSGSDTDSGEFQDAISIPSAEWKKIQEREKREEQANISSASAHKENQDSTGQKHPEVITKPTQSRAGGGRRRTKRRKYKRRKKTRKRRVKKRTRRRKKIKRRRKRTRRK